MQSHEELSSVKDAQSGQLARVCPGANFSWHAWLTSVLSRDENES